MKSKTSKPRKAKLFWSRKSKNFLGIKNFCGFRIENSDNSQKHKVSEA